MRILITNDDGIGATGINALIKCFEKNTSYEIFVAAPAFENSATSHAITVHEPIFVDEHNFFNKKIKAWSITGKPADCVKIALDTLIDKKPNIVISGINRGPNLGLDTVYSGTVSAALEASMHHIPAVAFSLNTKHHKADYDIAANIALDIVKNYEKFKIPKTTMLNINIPYLKKENIRGLKVTRLGEVAYNNVFVPRKDLQGRTYYWLGGEYVRNPNNTSETDLGALEEGWVTITPLNYDLTDNDSLKRLINFKI